MLISYLITARLVLTPVVAAFAAALSTFSMLDNAHTVVAREEAQSRRSTVSAYVQRKNVESVTAQSTSHVGKNIFPIMKVRMNITK